MRRWRELLKMPGEWLEIIAGAGAVLWALGWIRLLAAPGHRLRLAYHDLLALPVPVQIMLILVATLGGLLQTATAIVDEARLRFCSSVGMSIFFSLVTLYVWWAVGFGPTVACYSIQISLGVVAAVLLGVSGYVRV